MLAHMKIKDFKSKTVPEDLSEGFDRNTFLGLIYEAVQSVDWPRPAVSPIPEQVSPAVLSTLLTYCYATGVYSSREIEYAASSDKTVRYICANQRPSWPAIRQFRRQNMPWIRKALGKILALRAEQKEKIGECYAGWSIRRRGIPDAPDFSQEAEARLRRAIQADSMALDE